MPNRSVDIIYFSSEGFWHNINLALQKTRKAMQREIIKMKDVQFSKTLFENYYTGTVVDSLLCSYNGLPKGVNYMIIGDPGSGKTTIILDMLANIQHKHLGAKILFISAEMNEIDLAIYVERYPKFKYIDILFVESDIDSDTRNWQTINNVLNQGWDVVAIDSFSELQGVVKEEENIRIKDAESLLLTAIKRHNKAHNERKVHTTFLTIQQVTKTGAFVGSNRLKHMITAMMELRFDNPKNIYSDRYALFTKHRRGDVGVKLYYNLSATGDVAYDQTRFEQDRRIKKMQSDVANRIKNFADEFDKLFTYE